MTPSERYVLQPEELRFPLLILLVVGTSTVGSGTSGDLFTTLVLVSVTVSAALFVRSLFDRAKSWRELTVGEDGLRVERGGARRFVRYGDVVDVTERGERGATIHVHRAPSIAMQFLPEQRTRALDRIRRSVERANASKTSGLPALPPPAPLPAATAQYRVAEIPRERLWDVAEHPDAALEDRAVALRALTESLDVEAGDPRRLRVLAETSASPEIEETIEQTLRKL